MTDDPEPKSYRPFVSARYPGRGKPSKKPKWRVVVHRQHVDKWNQLLELCGVSNADELWEHLSQQPDQPPKLGSVSLMKGKLGKKAGSMSRVHHYRITGAGRIDYRYDPKFVADGGDEHPVVQIISIDFSSH